MRLYEDMIAGRISEQISTPCWEKTQTEQTELKTKVSEAESGCPMKSSLPMTQNNGWKPFRNTQHHRAGRSHPQPLNQRIVVHERIDEDKTRHISIEIHFNLKPIPEVEQVTA